MVKPNNKVQSKVCPRCSYDFNEADALVCEICQTSLISDTQIVSDAGLLKKTSKMPSRTKALSNGDFFGLFVKGGSQEWKNIAPYLDTGRLQKPVNLLGLFFVALGVMLWINYFLVIRPNRKVIQASAQTTSEEFESIPQGLFNYGGAPIFAPIVASGVNGLIESKYPGYELRYTKPLNRDYSSHNGIKMLMDGELSFAYNERSLTEEEYKAASLRDLKLKQIPIALDALVVYGNNRLNVEKLTTEQLRKIFIGEINNWNQINPAIADLPIVPVMVENEDLQLLETANEKQEFAKTTKLTANYTQALREVIATPGSVSFASASIVKNQRLIKAFALSDGGSSEYISPIIGDKLNIQDFKSGRYPITRRIFIVLREDGTLDRDAGMLYVKYLSSVVGEEKIKEAGLVPIIKQSNERSQTRLE